MTALVVLGAAGCLPGFEDQCAGDDECADGTCRSGLCVRTTGGSDALGAGGDAEADGARGPDAGRRDAAPPRDGGGPGDAAPSADRGPADDAAAFDAAPTADQGPPPDAGAAPDASTRLDGDVDGGDLPDAGGALDAGFSPDAAPTDGGPGPDAAPRPDGGSSLDAGPQPDARPVEDARASIDMAPIVDAAPPADVAAPDAAPPCDLGETRPCGPPFGCAGAETCGQNGWGPCEGARDVVAETCNRVDDDCDGRPDEGVTRPCGSDVGLCEPGIERCVDGDWTFCQGGVRPQVVEVCDGLDQDCDGSVDEGPGEDVLVCAAPNASGTCIDAACVEFRCDIGWLNTAGTREDGCERGCGPGIVGRGVANVLPLRAFAFAASEAHTVLAYLEPDADRAEGGALKVLYDEAQIAVGDGVVAQHYDDVQVVEVDGVFLIVATVQRRNTDDLLFVARLRPAQDGTVSITERYDAVSLAAPPAVATRLRPDGQPEALVAFGGLSPALLEGGGVVAEAALVALRLDLGAAELGDSYEVIEEPSLQRITSWRRTAAVATEDGYVVFGESLSTLTLAYRLEAYRDAGMGWFETQHATGAGPLMQDAPRVARRGDALLLASRGSQRAELRVVPYRLGVGFDNARVTDLGGGTTEPAVYATEEGFVVIAGGPGTFQARFYDAAGVPVTESMVSAVLPPAEGEASLYALRVDASDHPAAAAWWVQSGQDRVSIQIGTLACE